MTQLALETTTAPIRLGVAVRVLGRPGLRARDGRRAEHAPHLSVSLLHVREVLLYLAERRIGCYRLAEDLAPYLDRADMCGDKLSIAVRMVFAFTYVDSQLHW